MRNQRFLYYSHDCQDDNSPFASRRVSVYVVLYEIVSYDYCNTTFSKKNKKTKNTHGESHYSSPPVRLWKRFSLFIREHDSSSCTEKAYIKNTPYTYGTLIIIVVIIISRLEGCAVILFVGSYLLGIMAFGNGYKIAIYVLWYATRLFRRFAKYRAAYLFVWRANVFFFLFIFIYISFSYNIYLYLYVLILTYVLISTMVFGKLSVCLLRKKSYLLRKACSRRNVGARLLPSFGCINRCSDRWSRWKASSPCFRVIRSLFYSLPPLQIFLRKWSNRDFRGLVANSLRYNLSLVSMISSLVLALKSTSYQIHCSRSSANGKTIKFFLSNYTVDDNEVKEFLVRPVQTLSLHLYDNSVQYYRLCCSSEESFNQHRLTARTRLPYLAHVS